LHALWRAIRIDLPIWGEFSYFWGADILVVFIIIFDKKLK
jgi:hypothetical protein